MRETVPEPLHGRSIHDWAVPVTRALNAPEESVGAARRNDRNRRAGRLYPWEVRFDGSLAEGEGAWIIYLPGDSLIVDGAHIAPVDAAGDGLVAASGYPAGWYVIPDAPSAPSAVYLGIYSGDDDYMAILAFDAPETPEGYEELALVTVATLAVEVDASSAFVRPLVTCTVEQLVVGALIMGGGGAETPAGRPVGGAGCWCLVSDEGETPVYTFGNQYYKRGEVVYSANFDTTANSFIAESLPFIALKIPATDATSATVQLVGYADFAAMHADSLDEDWVIKPLYFLDSDCTVICDFRDIPEAQIVEVLQ